MDINIIYAVVDHFYFLMGVQVNDSGTSINAYWK